MSSKVKRPRPAGSPFAGKFGPAVERAVLALAALERESPASAVKLVLQWLAQDRFLVADCRCGEDGCPAKALQAAVQAVRDYVALDTARERRGEGSLQATGFNRPPPGSEH